MGSLEELVKLV
jgi:hypothetical protein